MLNLKQIVKLSALGLTSFATAFMVNVSYNPNIAEYTTQPKDLISISIGGEPAQAWFSDAAKLFRDNFGTAVQLLWSPYNKQVYMTELSQQEVNAIGEQYRDRADGVLLERAIERALRQYGISGWRAIRPHS